MNEYGGHWWNDTDRGDRSIGRNITPSATLYTANTKKTGLRSNPDLQGDVGGSPTS
jgi:hypothetical protein